MHESLNTLSEIVYEKRMILEKLTSERNQIVNSLCERQEQINRTEGQINRLESELKQLADITYGNKCVEDCDASLVAGPASQKTYQGAQAETRRD